MVIHGRGEGGKGEELSWASWQTMVVQSSFIFHTQFLSPVGSDCLKNTQREQSVWVGVDFYQNAVFETLMIFLRSANSAQHIHSWLPLHSFSQLKQFIGAWICNKRNSQKIFFLHPGCKCSLHFFSIWHSNCWHMLFNVTVFHLISWMVLIKAMYFSSAGYFFWFKN